MKTIFPGTLLLIVLIVVTGGNHGVFAMQQHGMTPEQMNQMNQMMQPQACPMMVQGADVAVSDTKDGVAVTFTAKTTESVAELRRRVEQMAKMHDAMSGMPMMAGNMTASTVKYQEVANGARLTLTPKDEARLPELRKQVAAHVEEMKKGNCSGMMQGMMQGMGR